jgi:hypothetical protein
MGSLEGRGPQKDKTPDAKSLYGSISLDKDIWDCFLSAKSFYGLWPYLNWQNELSHLLMVYMHIPAGAAFG